jgi:ATP-dependent RNA helicase DeaD
MSERSIDAPNGAFSELGLAPALLNELTALGYEEPTPIQREAIPSLLEGHDLLGQAATGTGKTAAFALPLLQQLAEDSSAKPPLALILVPTRELAVQVAEAMHRYGRGIHARVLPIYGGQPIGSQLRALDRGVHFVVATPGRALDHIRRGTLKLENVRTVVLDEADEMLDMGFAEDLEAILAATPADRQTVLFSATMPPRIAALARRQLRDPVKVEIAREPLEEGEAPKVRQTAYIVHRAQKLLALGRVLDVEAPNAALVFCRTRTEVEEVADTLNARGYRAEALHGGMSQEQRDRAMGRLRSGTADLLVATDVAARGLDIDLLTHVINYDVPSAPAAYVHRIGRVGRAGREGVAITLAEPREHRMLKNIERVTRQRIAVAKVPTVADLRARRLELTRASLRETILGEDTEHFRVVVESLASEFDLMDIAMAAVKLAHKADGTDDEDENEIRDVAPPRERAPAGRDRGPRDERPRDDRPRDDRPRRPRDDAAPRRGRTDAGTARIFIGVGRNAGIRPQDLVGAIANEAGLSGRFIGAIEISDDASWVEVPQDAAATVVAALRGTKLRGKRAVVRRE